jgi:hypothetical protein
LGNAYSPPKIYSSLPRRTRSAGAEVGKKTLMVFQVVY